MTEKKDLVLGQDNFWKNIPDLQYRIKKQPDLYVKEVIKCIEMFKEQFAKVIESPAQKNELFIELSLLLANVSDHYKDDLGFFHLYLIDLLEKYASLLNPLILLKSVICLILLRSKNLINPLKTVSLFMKLFQIKHKELRKIMIAHMINDIKRINVHHKNMAINKQIQNLIFEIIKNNKDNSAKRALHIMIQLYKKNIWNDSKTANIISLGCLNPYYKVKLIACHFLIETTENIDPETSDDEDEITDPSQLRIKRYSKKTKGKTARFEKEKKRVTRKIKRKGQVNHGPSFFPIDLLNNPQDFIEKLFTDLKKSNDKFDVKMAVMSVISRVVGRHNLFLLNYYSFLLKYCYPHQNEIGKILLYIAEACHPLIPAEELQFLVKHIIDNFVNDRCSEDKICMGLNVLREMCVKNSLIMDEFHLNYLAEYKDYRNKNVASAAKSIINLFRQLNPKLLHKKFQGRRIEEELELNPNAKYGQDIISETIDGSEVLGTSKTGVPVCFDKILDDGDFKRMKLYRQRQIIEEDKKYQKKYANEYEQHENELNEEYEEDEEDEEEDVEDEEDEEYEEDDENEDNEEVDENDEIEEENDDGNNEENDKEENYEDKEEIENKQKDVNGEKPKIQQKKKLKKKAINDLDEEILEEIEEEDGNPHGFLSEQKITYFKKRGKESKLERKELMKNQKKEKKYNGPKEKKGGTTNEEKNKHKPLMMVRFKQHKERNRVDSVKKKIKKIKLQLGHVRSGKQAKRLKKQRMG